MRKGPFGTFGGSMYLVIIVILNVYTPKKYPPSPELVVTVCVRVLIVVYIIIQVCECQCVLDIIINYY